MGESNSMLREKIFRETLRGLWPDEILDIAEEYGRLYEVEYATFNNVLTYASEHLALFKDKYIFINSIPGYFIEGEDEERLVKQYSDLLSQCTIEINQIKSDEGGNK